MLRQKYLPMLIFIWINYSCRCQNLGKFVAPILNQKMAPLMAIVDTTDISSHVVRSIEMPLREIINSTVDGRISEMLKEEVDSLQQNIGDNRNQMTGVNQDISTLREEIEVGKKTSREIFEQLNNFTRAVSNVNTNMDEKVKKLGFNMHAIQFELQQKMDEHIGYNRNQLTEVKHDIATLRKEMEERITCEILDKLNNFTNFFSTENKNLIEKVTKLTNNVDVMQSDLKETIVSVESNVTNLARQLKNHLTSFEALRSNLQELTDNTSIIQNATDKFKTTTDIDKGMLKVHDSKLEGLNATVKDINLRVSLFACVEHTYVLRSPSTIKFPDITTSEGITIQRLTSFKSSGVFVCDVPALYHIYVEILSYQKYGFVKIFKNNIELILSYMYTYITGVNKSAYSNAAIVLTTLQEGDTIDIKPGKKIMHINGRNYSRLTIVKVT